RHGHQRGEEHDHDRAANRRPDSADARGRYLRRDLAGQERPADGRGALGDHLDQDEPQRDDHSHEREHHQNGRETVACAPPAPRLPEVKLLLGDDGHQAPLLRRADRSTIPWAATLMMIVNANRSTPIPISAARNSPLDSPNWFAMTAGML